MPAITFDHHITPQQLCDMRAAVDWKPLSPRQAKAGVDNAAWLLAARVDGELAGLVRVIGDGGYVFYIADVIVHPSYQGHGLGRAMMERTLAHIRSTALPGERLMIVLVTSPGKEAFYERFGFERRPNEENGAGMTQWYDAPADT